jgi:molecular chaperone DnaK (HSP70)
MKKIAIDFGTTNTVIAVWREATQTAETIRLSGLSQSYSATNVPPLIPSIVYVSNGASAEVLVGQEVRENGHDILGDERHFASFKRGIAATIRPFARQIDGTEWDESRAGAAFLSRVLTALAEEEGEAIDELVFSVPVHSFESYLKWLRDEASLFETSGIQVTRMRVVDESTAAALGYDVRSPGELLMVFDFGGGTLDVSLVRMPVAEEGSTVILDDGRSLPEGQLRGILSAAGARVVAKAGRILGGDDIDHWILDEVLARNGVVRNQIGNVYDRLKIACEGAKLRLSNHETADINVFDPDTEHRYRATLSRPQLEDLLERHGFYEGLQKTINQVLRSARARGLFPEDIGAVLMIGGTSLIPSVSRIIRTQFGSERVFEDKPFEAVCHGALKLTLGMGLDDLLYHSYAIRHLSPHNLQHEWEEIIGPGTRYPLEEPLTVVLAASRDGQDALELVIGEVDEAAGGVSEVRFGERSLLMVEGAVELRKVAPLNDQDGARTLAYLDPPGKAGHDRIKADFEVDSNRTLRVTVTDLLTDRVLLDNKAVVELR